MSYSVNIRQHFNFQCLVGMLVYAYTRVCMVPAYLCPNATVEIWLYYTFKACGNSINSCFCLLCTLCNTRTLATLAYAVSY